MTREQIEKAAKETLVNEPVEIQATKVGAFQRGFIAGSQWRINSVWHDMKKEVPQVYGEYENVLALIGSVPVVAKGYHVRARIRDISHWLPIPKFEKKK